MKIEIIQLLRGIAALLVVLLHFQPILRNEWPQAAELMSHGQIGVDIFFVVSGFVIYTSTANAKSRVASSFLIRRFFRVVIPAWAAMFLLACVIPPYLKDLFFGVLFMPPMNSHPPSYGYNFLLVTWTLTYELIFYFIFAVALSTKIGRQYRGIFTTTLIVGAMLFVQTITGKYTIDAATAATVPDVGYLPIQLVSLLGNPLFLEFVVGLGLAWMYENKLLLAYRRWILVLCILTAPTIIAFHYQDGNGLARSGFLACVIVTFALITQVYFYQLEKKELTNLLAFGVFFGEISYSLYLVHPIIRTVVTSSSAFMPLRNAGGPALTFALLVSCTLVASYLFYRFIEVPAQRHGKRYAGLMTPSANSVEALSPR